MSSPHWKTIHDDAAADSCRAASPPGTAQDHRRQRATAHRQSPRGRRQAGEYLRKAPHPSEYDSREGRFAAFTPWLPACWRGSAPPGQPFLFRAACPRSSRLPAIRSMCILQLGPVTAGRRAEPPGRNPFSPGLVATTPSSPPLQSRPLAFSRMYAEIAPPACRSPDIQPQTPPP